LRGLLISIKKMNKKLQIAVVCPAGKEEYPAGKTSKDFVYDLCEEVGFLLAKVGVVVITGGKSGGMERASKGAKKASGLTIGIVKGKDRFTSNPFVDVEVISGMTADGFDEFLLVNMSDALIVVGGGAGTLEEITLAYRNCKPIVAIKGTGGWADKTAGTFLDERKKIKVQEARNPEEAVKMTLRSISQKYAK
jgi:uncharacterized protein (TIGR00725 family)